MNLFKTISDLPVTILNIAADLSSLTQYVERVMNRPPPTPPPEKHFVCVYIEGLIKETIHPPYKPPDLTDRPSSIPEISEYGWIPDTPMLDRRALVKVRRGTMVDSAFIQDQHTFRIQPNQNVKNLRFTIFCDLSKVRIEMAKCANQDLSFYNENAPIAYFDGEVTPSNAITIHCRVR